MCTSFFSAISETVFWDVFGYIYVIFGKVLPFILIAVLDIIIFIKMKRIFKKRTRFRSTRRNAVLTLPSLTDEFQSHEMQSIGETNLTTTAKVFQKYFKKNEKENQLKLTKILLMLGLFHFLTTLMETIGYFMLTFYRSAWMEFEYK